MRKSSITRGFSIGMFDCSEAGNFNYRVGRATRFQTNLYNPIYVPGQ